MSDNNTLSTEQLLALDKAHIWHPYASMIDAPPVYPIVSAEGVRLKMADGAELIDGMSSWWSVIHGYNHPVLNQAAKDQLEDMSHVMFGGITHPSAVKLAKLLVDITPASLNKVFFSDSGSVAVEVAIKMAIQYWYSVGRKEKHQLLTLKNGYHGDTFGAMATCDPVTGMHHMFSEVLPKHLFAEKPRTKFGEEFDEEDISSFKTLIEENHQYLAAVILEPIVQGTGGMNFYSPEYLKRVRQLCDQYDVLLIADEIATGFGRTGKLFACEHADIEPDILCVGKCLTGGYLSLAATLCNDKVTTGICEGEAGVLMHGPTFMANPLATAISYASVQLLLSQDWQSVVNNLETQLSKGLSPAKDLDNVADVRVLGSIGVIELKQPVDMAAIQKKLVDRGIWVRPFGKLIYTIPPYVISNEDISILTAGLVDSIEN
ncbi:MAG: adenosylmethionine--8-amino-7-oxononanoate transaminase [Oceanicoccus sp.]|uniref:adenosylmethionine--8-amino-7-oxononanoate transaminase n=1 Tax=Oceanicoccus sp. TaxID=2691044 RepID=UPI0026043D41|nr:adenosylmethionine--8-amino-7-oxononanoate transaminase [Oceanicoccus sp.]MCP3907314.1 adenosylmethionine--8-amino-7-oxononanoate transaminase [Oceanicoccus sp.]